MAQPPKRRKYLPLPTEAVAKHVQNLHKALPAFFSPNILEQMVTWDPQARNGAVVRALVETPIASKSHIVATTPDSGDTYAAHDPMQYAKFDLARHFTAEGPTPLTEPLQGLFPDLIVSAPTALMFDDFALACLHHARYAVALLVKTAYLENATRHTRLFTPHPPTAIISSRRHVPPLTQPHSWVFWKMDSDHNPPTSGRTTQHLFV